MKKSQRKAFKRQRIALVRKTQDQWIAHFGLDAPTSRKQRDAQFTAAQKLSLVMQGMPHVVA